MCDNDTTNIPLEVDENNSEGSFESIHKPASGNCWGKGIIADFKKTVGTYWKAEMTNPNQKTAAVSFFLFFACIAPAITFGAIYAKATHNYIGAVEMILATAWCGIFYAIFGGQPMMINGGTGPVLAFTEVLYKLSISLDVPFLTFNAWIGMWVAFYMLLAAFFDLNKVIVYATRFTDEIFSFLIATIFIINALANPFAPIGVFYYFRKDHTSHDPYEEQPGYSYMATALLSLILCLGTVQLSFLLRKFKFSPFFPNQTIRNVITDFAVVASIFIMSIIAYVLGSTVPTEKLNVPDRFAPTYACCTSACTTNWPEECPDLSAPDGYRSWVVDMSDLNGKTWVPFMAAGPAVLAFVLVFLDDGITWHLINHPAHKLTHGDAYNYDTIIIGIMVAVNSILGLPWLVAATVRSLNHVHAMAEKDQSGKILSVQETRLTHLGIHVLCLIAIFALDVLKLIPVPVLYGVFLFMGLVSLGTNQFWGRILMFVMQPSKYPIEPYTKYVEPLRMHIFTILQLSLFGLLYAVKSIKSISIAFPIVIAACIPIRLYILPRIFTLEELVMLDSDDGTIKRYLEYKRKGEAQAQKLIDAEVEKDAPNNDDVEKQDPDAIPPGRKYKRQKSTSCPVDMFSTHVAPDITSYHPRFELRGSALELRSSSMAGDLADTFTTHHDCDTEDIDVAEAEDKLAPLPSSPKAGTRQRPRRTKTMSCPTPHMLFEEANRQMASNYFFG